MTAALSDRTAPIDHPILDLLAERWSPRAYDAGREVGEDELKSALEAARWSPSAYNAQPWRFAVGRRGGAVHQAILDSLVEFNQGWARRAGALVLAAVEVDEESGEPNPIALYDLGQAVAHLSVQAHADGLHVHQMSGFDAAAAAAALDLPASVRAVSVVALGHVAEPELLDDPLRERETAPRSRKALDELVLRAD